MACINAGFIFKKKKINIFPSLFRTHTKKPFYWISYKKRVYLNCINDIFHRYSIRRCCEPKYVNKSVSTLCPYRMLKLFHFPTCSSSGSFIILFVLFSLMYFYTDPFSISHVMRQTIYSGLNVCNNMCTFCSSHISFLRYKVDDYKTGLGKVNNNLYIHKNNQ